MYCILQYELGTFIILGNTCGNNILKQLCSQIAPEYRVGVSVVVWISIIFIYLYVGVYIVAIIMRNYSMIQPCMKTNNVTIYCYYKNFIAITCFESD